MKQERPRFTRAALLCAAALLAAPAVAQDTTAAPPPAAAAAPVAPPTVVPTIDATTNVTGGKTTSPTPVNPEAAAQAAAEDAQRHTATRTASRPAARPATAKAAPKAAPARTAAAAPAVETPAPSAAPIPAPVAAAPEAVPPAPLARQPVAPVEATAPADTQPDTATTQTTTTTTGGSSLPWIILGVLVIAGLAAAFLFRRRRADAEVYEQPVYAEPVHEPAVAPVAERAPIAPVAPVAAAPIVAAVTEPVDVAPATADDATIEEPAAADVAALTAGNPAGDRPWLELAMRPIRAGTNVDEALVEIELTVGNAGTMQADDVRISTFMLPAGSDGEMDRLLTESRVDASVEPLTIAAGEGTRVDTTLALSRADLMANDATTFQPVVVADARYRLPDGSEGRTSASFVIGIASDGELGLLELDRPILREDVEARLYREPARV